MINRYKKQKKVGRSNRIAIGNSPSEVQGRLHIKEKSPLTIQGIHEDGQKIYDGIQKIHEEVRKKEIKAIKKVDVFDQLTKDNKSTGRPWYHGIDGTWWWGMTEEGARQKMIDEENNPKIAIASIIRDEERSGNLIRFLDCCRDLERYHKNIVYIFIEGDSSDRTYEILQDWTLRKEGSVLEKIDRGHSPFPKVRDPKRTTYFAELRNRLIQLILSRQDICEVLMIDASYGWKGDLIASLRDTGADISAPLVVSHKNDDGKYIFYDIWGFRKNGREFGPFYPYMEGMESCAPVDIDSAGGGYLIKREVLETGVKYSGGDCEHVSFCTLAKSKGFKIAINPGVYIRKGGFKE